MKYLQTLLRISPLTFCLFFFNALAAAPASLATADSLFKARQYTQAAEQFQSIFAQGHYTPAMLLKMAYIEEGLGRIPTTLYYLSLYYQATDDAQVLTKMDELATKYGLSGYNLRERNYWGHWFVQARTLWIGILTALLILSFAIGFFRRRQAKPAPLAWLAVIVLAIGIVGINFLNEPQQAILQNDNTYLMAGPSAAAPVKVILPAGNQMQITGRKDVWLRVQWMDQQVYVKQDAVLIPEL